MFFKYFIFFVTITRNFYQHIIVFCIKIIRLRKNRLQVVWNSSMRYLTYKPSVIENRINIFTKNNKDTIQQLYNPIFFIKDNHRFRLIHNTAFLLTHSNTLLDPDSICTLFSCLFRFSSASLSFEDNLATRRCWSHAKTIFSSSFHMAHRSRLARKSAHE